VRLVQKRDNDTEFFNGNRKCHRGKRERERERGEGTRSEMQRRLVFMNLNLLARFVFSREENLNFAPSRAVAQCSSAVLNRKSSGEIIEENLERMISSGTRIFSASVRSFNEHSKVFRS